MPTEFAFGPIDPLWIIAMASIVQALTLLVLVRAIRGQAQISRESLVAASSTELRLVGLQSLRGGTSQLWEIQNVGPNVAFDVRVSILPNDGRRHREWIDTDGPSHIDSRSSTLYEASGHLGDEALIRITWTTLNGNPIEKTFSWIRDAVGDEQIAVVQR